MKLKNKLCIHPSEIANVYKAEDVDLARKAIERRLCKTKKDYKIVKEIFG